jgi:hypothetical protein
LPFDRVVRRIETDSPQPLVHNPKHGPTRWFAITAWHDLIVKAQGHAWLDDSWYKPPEKIDDSWMLRCGAYDIAYEEDLIGLNRLKDFHQRLRSDRQLTKVAHGFEKTRTDLEGETTQLRGLLQEFADLERIPGRCELCMPGSD